MTFLNRKVIMVVGVVFVLGAFVTVANASHSWGNYHWGRTANPFTLQLGDNVSSNWDGHLATSATDWSASTVLDTTVVKGSTKARNCRAKDGKAEICSANYGATGWLGIAQIWVSGDHITKGVVKVNDTYFNTSPYNSALWRDLVMCQEIGHVLGLGHVDEDFDNASQGTCMDYSANPTDADRHPNQHDYDQLEAIYAHLDSINTVAGGDDGGDGDDGGGNGNGRGGRGKPANTPNVDLNDPSAWGRAISEDAQGNDSLFVRNLGNGEQLFTFVTWVE